MPFKKLFEVRLLHDYYLIPSEGGTFYGLNEQDQKNALTTQLTYNQYKIAHDIKIVPTTLCEKALKSYKLRFLPTSLGFMVVGKVISKISDTGEEVYEPFIGIPDDLTLSFNLMVKNANFRNFTALSFNPSFPFHYYFDNKNENNDKHFPALSLPVLPFVHDRTYEMGDLATFGTDQKQAITITTNNPTDWQSIEGQGMLHQNDRHLLPKRFLYKFQNEEVLSAEFSLKSLSGELIKKITSPADSSTPFKQFRLDFSNQAPIEETDIVGEEISDGWYHLTISTNNGTNITQKVLLHNDLYRGKSLGAIEIKNEVTDPLFRITNTDKTLITKTLANGTTIQHPIFEIRLRSRSTYWRYKQVTGLTAAEMTQIAPFFNTENADLVTKKPTPLAIQRNQFTTNNSISLVFPSPAGADIQPEPNGKTYSNIYISKLNSLSSS